MNQIKNWRRQKWRRRWGTELEVNKMSEISKVEFRRRYENKNKMGEKVE